jgi:hypothetical protein
MIRLRPRLFILIGFLLMLLGVLLPFLMVIKLLESTFFLNFFSFGASMVGLVMGILGVAQFTLEIRRSRDK